MSPDAALMTALTAKGGIRNKKIVAYFEQQLYPDLKLALSEVSLSYNNLLSNKSCNVQLITEIHNNGELEKYWTQIEKKSYTARKTAARLEKMK